MARYTKSVVLDVQDVEREDIIWVDKYNKYLLVEDIKYNQLGDYIFIFDTGEFAIYTKDDVVTLM